MSDAEVTDLALDISDMPEIEILISALEHYSYCPRQCALIHIEQTYDENLYTMRGKLMHERVDSGDERANRGIETQRGIPLWSERYGLRGKADAVEWHNGIPYPVEYKSGKRHGKHADIQLCAQALCLEDMLGINVPQGAIYYGATRKRQEIAFDAALRERTLAIIAELRTMLTNQLLPNAPNDARCPNCSLITACLPHVASTPDRLQELQQLLFTPLRMSDAKE